MELQAPVGINVPFEDTKHSQKELPRVLNVLLDELILQANLILIDARNSMSQATSGTSSLEVGHLEQRFLIAR